MLDWFRFVLTAVLMLAGLFVLLVGVVSQYRFRYVLNRMHAATNSTVDSPKVSKAR